MNSFLHYLLITHIAAGSLALLSGPIAMLNQNGNNIHRKAGNIFFYAMTIVFVSAVILSIAKSNVFLLIIAVFSYQLISVAMRALHLRKLHLDQKPAVIDWFISIVAGLFNISLVIWALWQLIILKNSFGYAALTFGVFGIRFAYVDVSRFIKKPETKNHWLFLHIGGMIGGYIATSTAFLVNVVHCDYPVLLWLTPVSLLYPFLVFTNRKFKKKLNNGEKEVAEYATVKI